MSAGYAQSSVKIKLRIKLRPIEHYKHHLKKCDVIFYKDYIKTDSTRVRGYKFRKKINSFGFFRIDFKKEGYVTKNIVINANSLPKNKSHKHKLKAEISLFRQSENTELEFLKKEPISIAYYNETSENLVWDFEYNRSIIEKIIHAQTKSK
jgi:hypothetical protein